MRRAALRSLGCKVNAYETEAMRQMLEKAGYKIVSFDHPAEVYVVNTCSVTNIADRKSRQMLHRAKKLNPEAVVVAVGCYAQVAGDKLRQDPAVDLIVGTNQKSSLPRMLEEYFHNRAQTELPEASGRIRRYEDLSIDKVSDHIRAYIKIQDGCDQFCSYCIIPYARGRSRSRRPEEILREAENLVGAGFRELVVTGIHISSYGLDMSEEDRVSLAELLERLDKIPGLARLRLGSLEPRIVTEEFVFRLSRLKTICPHFHLSLQSGSDTVLRRMNRHYTADRYRQSCGILRSQFDRPAITTDVIVGFPGETEAEFEETERLIRDIEFYELHVFPYSRREGTRAAAMADPIPESVKKERCARLLWLDKELSSRYRRSFLGQETEVLLEEKMVLEGEEYLVGHTRQYVKGAVCWDESLRGRLITGRFDCMLTDEVAKLASIERML